MGSLHVTAHAATMMSDDASLRQRTGDRHDLEVMCRTCDAGKIAFASSKIMTVPAVHIAAERVVLRSGAAPERSDHYLKKINQDPGGGLNATCNGVHV